MLRRERKKERIDLQGRTIQLHLSPQVKKTSKVFSPAPEKKDCKFDFEPCDIRINQNIFVDLKGMGYESDRTSYVKSADRMHPLHSGD